MSLKKRLEELAREKSEQKRRARQKPEVSSKRILILDRYAEMIINCSFPKGTKEYKEMRSYYYNLGKF